MPTPSPRCKCRCGYSCFVDGHRTCGLDVMECMQKHYFHDCEHKWDGEGAEGTMGYGSHWSSNTCSKCGVAQIHHDMMVGP